MPFEIAPQFMPVVPKFPIAPLTDARKCCLRLAGLIREGCPDVEERETFHGCAVGAAYYAKTKRREFQGLGSYTYEIAGALALPLPLIIKVSEVHYRGFVHGGSDSRLQIADRLERGEFDQYAAYA